MKQYLNRTINFIKDEILRLKRFTSPMDGKFVTKHQHDKEIKYMADVDVMFTTIEDCIFSSEEFESEKQSSTLLQNDARYVEMYNRIIAEGIKAIPEEDQVWLRAYLAENKTHWHNSKFHMVRRED